MRMPVESRAHRGRNGFRPRNGLNRNRPITRLQTPQRNVRISSIPDPHRNLGDDCTEGIQQRIPGRGVAARHEQLVKFIRRRIGGYDCHCQDGPTKLPASLGTRDRAKYQHTENEVFGEMRRLPNEYMQKLQSCQLRVREHPVQYRNNKAASLVRCEHAC
jgi:hypothetical protein